MTPALQMMMSGVIRDSRISRAHDLTLLGSDRSARSHFDTRKVGHRAPCLFWSAGKNYNSRADRRK